MAYFRKKPVVIQAVCWNGATIGLTNKAVDLTQHHEPDVRLDMPDWLPKVSRQVTDEPWPSPVPAGEVWRDGDDLWIGTLEGPHKAEPGDWIIRGTQGEIYPCKPDVFDEIYGPPKVRMARVASPASLDTWFVYVGTVDDDYPALPFDPVTVIKRSDGTMHFGRADSFAWSDVYAWSLGDRT